MEEETAADKEVDALVGGAIRGLSHLYVLLLVETMGMARKANTMEKKQQRKLRDALAILTDVPKAQIEAQARVQAGRAYRARLAGQRKELVQ